MPKLSELTAAGDSRTLPGYTLSPWTLRDYGDAESEFARAHIAMAGASVDGLPPEVQEKIIRAAMDDVKRGEFCYGRRNFDMRMFAPANVPLLLWISLRKEHPVVTREIAGSLVTRENESLLHRATLECARYSTDRTKVGLESESFFEWGKVFALLRKGHKNGNGLSYDQIAGMTIAQVCAELGINDEETEEDHDDKERNAANKRVEILRRVMKECGWTKEQLAARPVDELVMLVKRIGKQNFVDPGMLGVWVQEFVSGG